MCSLAGKHLCSNELAPVATVQTHVSLPALRGEAFKTADQARLEISCWRIDYNEVRPHSAIGCVSAA